MIQWIVSEKHHQRQQEKEQQSIRAYREFFERKQEGYWGVPPDM